MALCVQVSSYFNHDIILAINEVETYVPVFQLLNPVFQNGSYYHNTVAVNSIGISLQLTSV